MITSSPRHSLLALCLILSACSDDPAPISLAVTGEDLDLCMNDWPSNGRYRVTNLLGDVEASLAAAQSPVGVDFPAGTLIQLIPTEAMLKREPGFDENTNDWEFFQLEITPESTTIVSRGASAPVNMDGNGCFDCHSGASREWDFVCGADNDRGCGELSVGPEAIAFLQSLDQRCR